MKFDLLALGDHLPDPVTRRYTETQAERFRMWVDLGVKAERLGFDAYLLGEHHCSDYVLSSPQMILAAVAVQTHRIRLGTAVSLLPNNDPVRLAEDFATLDLLSNGRAEIGFGSGYTEHTFHLFGQKLSDSVEISKENLALIQKLWNEREINWSGTHRASIQNSQIEPRTYRNRAIPINRATASSVETARDAGTSGHRLMLLTVGQGFGDVRGLAEAYREAYRAAGHDPAEMSVSALAYVHVHPNGDTARARWAPYRDNYRMFTKNLRATKGLTRSLGELFARLTPETLAVLESDFCGSPTEIIEQIYDAHDKMGGFDRLICYFDCGGLPRDVTFESVELFADAVIPKVKASLTPSAV